MGKYSLEFDIEAERGIFKLQRNEPVAYRKLIGLLQELIDHPQTGTGKPERLKGNLSGMWSRRITPKHRLVYRIIDEKVRVYILSTYGHYGDR